MKCKFNAITNGKRGTISLCLHGAIDISVKNSLIVREIKQRNVWNGLELDGHVKGLLKRGSYIPYSHFSTTPPLYKVTI